MPRSSALDVKSATLPVKPDSEFLFRTLSSCFFLHSCIPYSIPSSLISTDEFQFDRLGDDAGLVGAVEQRADRLAAAFAKIERPVVHVHADELVGLAAGEGAAVLQRVLPRLGTVLQTVLDALFQKGRHLDHRGAAEIPANGE